MILVPLYLFTMQFINSTKLPNFKEYSSIINPIYFNFYRFKRQSGSRCLHKYFTAAELTLHLYVCKKKPWGGLVLPVN